MNKTVHLAIAVALGLTGCSSDGDSTASAASSTTQAEDQSTDTSESQAGTTQGTGEGESTGAQAPAGMLDACNGANTYTDPGDVPEEDISSEQERTTIEQVAALSLPIAEFKVVEGPNAEGGYLGFGEADGWAWYCIYGSDTGEARYSAFQAPTVIDGTAGPDDGQWDSVDLG